LNPPTSGCGAVGGEKISDQFSIWEFGPTLDRGIFLRGGNVISLGAGGFPS